MLSVLATILELSDIVLGCFVTPTIRRRWCHREVRLALLGTEAVV